MVNYPFDYIGKWTENRLMKPSEFIRERNIGELKVMLPTPPTDLTQILNHDLPIEQQKWVRAPKPNFKLLNQSEQDEYVLKELKKRNTGIFIYIHGGIEYLTGVHYWMLDNWVIDGKEMKFIDAQRDLFYVWDLCVEDTNSFGLAYYTQRRFGKSEAGMGIIYEYASKTFNTHCGIQSKTNKDASNLFRKLIQRWKRLPKWWKPVDTGENNPKRELIFDEPSKRDTKGREKTYTDVLESFIDFAASVEEAYDGYKMGRYYDDEFGKLVEGNAYTRWNIVKPTLLDGIEIIGKSIHTTTVEELDRKGGRAALEIWHDSDPSERKADGRTKSGLYRYFKPAYYGLRGYIDDYGYSDVEGAKEYLTKQRESLKGEKLADEIRKYPFTPHEAFMSATSGGIFPDHRLNDQLLHNSGLEEGTVRRGNFVWLNSNKTAADFFDDPNGRCLVAWMPPPEQRNRHEVIANGMNPLNTHLGGIGVDPYDIDETVNKKRSDGAIYVFRRFDSLVPLRSYCYVCEYVCRPELADIFFDDVAKICVFYGMKALIEDTKPACIKKMKEWGFSNYIAKTRQDEFTKTTSRNWRDGISTTGQGAREEMMNGLVLYTHKHVGKIDPKTQVEFYGIKEEDVITDLYGYCPFEHLLEDLKQFDVNKWTDYDATVAASLALMQAHRTKIVEIKDGVSLTTLFPTYDNSGMRSKRN